MRFPIKFEMTESLRMTWLNITDLSGERIAHAVIRCFTFINEYIKSPSK